MAGQSEAARGNKLELKLGIDMPFSGALERFLRVKPEEVEKSVEKSKRENDKESRAKPDGKAIPPRHRGG